MLGPPRSRCLQTLSAEDPISSLQTAVFLLYALTWWIRWGISVGLFPRGTSSLREGSTLIMHFPLYSPAPSFQYTFCKTNSTQRFSLCLPKIFFEYTNFLNPIFHSFWFSGWVLFSLGTTWICVAQVFGQAHPILPLYQEIHKMYTFLTL